MKTRKIPMRRCAGCMQSKPKQELIRITCYEGQVSLDPTGKAKGRGVYLCPSEDCLAKARKKRALQRSFNAELSQDQADQILDALRRHAQTLEGS